MQETFPLWLLALAAAMTMIKPGISEQTFRVPIVRSNVCQLESTGRISLEHSSHCSCRVNAEVNVVKLHRTMRQCLGNDSIQVCPVERSTRTAVEVIHETQVEESFNVVYSVGNSKSRTSLPVEKTGKWEERKVSESHLRDKNHYRRLVRNLKSVTPIFDADPLNRALSRHYRLPNDLNDRRATQSHPGNNDRRNGNIFLSRLLSTVTDSYELSNVNDDRHCADGYECPARTSKKYFKRRKRRRMFRKKREEDAPKSSREDDKANEERLAYLEALKLLNLSHVPQVTPVQPETTPFSPFTLSELSFAGETTDFSVDDRLTLSTMGFDYLMSTTELPLLEPPEMTERITEQPLILMTRTPEIPGFTGITTTKLKIIEEYSENDVTQSSLVWDNYPKTQESSFKLRPSEVTGSPMGSTSEESRTSAETTKSLGPGTSPVTSSTESITKPVTKFKPEVTSARSSGNNSTSSTARTTIRYSSTLRNTETSAKPRPTSSAATNTRLLSSVARTSSGISISELPTSGSLADTTVIAAQEEKVGGSSTSWGRVDFITSEFSTEVIQSSETQSATGSTESFQSASRPVLISITESTSVSAGSSVSEGFSVRSVETTAELVESSEESSETSVGETITVESLSTSPETIRTSSSLGVWTTEVIGSSSSSEVPSTREETVLYSLTSSAPDVVTLLISTEQPITKTESSTIESVTIRTIITTEGSSSSEVPSTREETVFYSPTTSEEPATSTLLTSTELVITKTEPGTTGTTRAPSTTNRIVETTEAASFSTSTTEELTETSTKSTLVPSTTSTVAETTKTSLLSTSPTEELTETSTKSTLVPSTTSTVTETTKTTLLSTSPTEELTETSTKSTLVPSTTSKVAETTETTLLSTSPTEELTETSIKSTLEPSTTSTVAETTKTGLLRTSPTEELTETSTKSTLIPSTTSTVAETTKTSLLSTSPTEELTETSTKSTLVPSTTSTVAETTKTTLLSTSPTEELTETSTKSTLVPSTTSTVAETTKTTLLSTSPTEELTETSTKSTLEPSTTSRVAETTKTSLLRTSPTEELTETSTKSTLVPSTTSTVAETTETTLLSTSPTEELTDTSTKSTLVPSTTSTVAETTKTSLLSTSPTEELTETSTKSTLVPSTTSTVAETTKTTLLSTSPTEELTETSTKSTLVPSTTSTVAETTETTLLITSPTEELTDTSTKSTLVPSTTSTVADTTETTLLSTSPTEELTETSTKSTLVPSTTSTVAETTETTLLSTSSTEKITETSTILTPTSSPSTSTTKTNTTPKSKTKLESTESSELETISRLVFTTRSPSSFSEESSNPVTSSEVQSERTTASSTEEVTTIIESSEYITEEKATTVSNTPERTVSLSPSLSTIGFTSSKATTIKSEGASRKVESTAPRKTQSVLGRETTFKQTSTGPQSSTELGRSSSHVAEVTTTKEESTLSRTSGTIASESEVSWTSVERTDTSTSEETESRIPRITETSSSYDSTLKSTSVKAASTSSPAETAMIETESEDLSGTTSKMTTTTIAPSTTRTSKKTTYVETESTELSTSVETSSSVGQVTSTKSTSSSFFGPESTIIKSETSETTESIIPSTIKETSTSTVYTTITEEISRKPLTTEVHTSTGAETTSTLEPESTVLKSETSETTESIIPSTIKETSTSTVYTTMTEEISRKALTTEVHTSTGAETTSTVEPESTVLKSETSETTESIIPSTIEETSTSTLSTSITEGISRKALTTEVHTSMGVETTSTVEPESTVLKSETSETTESIIPSTIEETSTSTLSTSITEGISRKPLTTEVYTSTGAETTSTVEPESTVLKSETSETTESIIPSTIEETSTSTLSTSITEGISRKALTTEVHTSTGAETTSTVEPESTVIKSVTSETTESTSTSIKEEADTSTVYTIVTEAITRQTSMGNTTREPSSTPESPKPEWEAESSTSSTISEGISESLSTKSSASILTQTTALPTVILPERVTSTQLEVTESHYQTESSTIVETIPTAFEEGSSMERSSLDSSIKSREHSTTKEVAVSSTYSTSGSAGVEETSTKSIQSALDTSTERLQFTTLKWTANESTSEVESTSMSSAIETSVNTFLSSAMTTEMEEEATLSSKALTVQPPFEVSTETSIKTSTVETSIITEPETSSTEAESIGTSKLIEVTVTTVVETSMDHPVSVMTTTKPMTDQTIERTSGISWTVGLTEGTSAPGTSIVIRTETEASESTEPQSTVSSPLEVFTNLVTSLIYTPSTLESGTWGRTTPELITRTGSEIQYGTSSTTTVSPMSSTGFIEYENETSVGLTESSLSESSTETTLRTDTSSYEGSTQMSVSSTGIFLRSEYTPETTLSSFEITRMSSSGSTTSSFFSESSSLGPLVRTVEKTETSTVVPDTSVPRTSTVASITISSTETSPSFETTVPVTTRKKTVLTTTKAKPAVATTIKVPGKSTTTTSQSTKSSQRKTTRAQMRTTVSTGSSEEAYEETVTYQDYSTEDYEDYEDYEEPTSSWYEYEAESESTFQMRSSPQTVPKSATVETEHRYQTSTPTHITTIESIAVPTISESTTLSATSSNAATGILPEMTSYSQYEVPTSPSESSTLELLSSELTTIETIAVPTTVESTTLSATSSNAATGILPEMTSYSQYEVPTSPSESSTLELSSSELTTIESIAVPTTSESTTLPATSSSAATGILSEMTFYSEYELPTSPSESSTLELLSSELTTIETIAVPTTSESTTLSATSSSAATGILPEMTSYSQYELPTSPSESSTLELLSSELTTIETIAVPTTAESTTLSATSSSAATGILSEMTFYSQYEVPTSPSESLTLELLSSELTTIETIAVPTTAESTTLSATSSSAATGILPEMSFYSQYEVPTSPSESSTLELSSSELTTIESIAVPTTSESTTLSATSSSAATGILSEMTFYSQYELSSSGGISSESMTTEASTAPSKTESSLWQTESSFTTFGTSQVITEETSTLELSSSGGISFESTSTKTPTTFVTTESSLWEMESLFTTFGTSQVITEEIPTSFYASTVPVGIDNPETSITVPSITSEWSVETDTGSHTTSFATTGSLSVKIPENETDITNIPMTLNQSSTNVSTTPMESSPITIEESTTANKSTTILPTTKVTVKLEPEDYLDQTGSSLSSNSSRIQSTIASVSQGTESSRASDLRGDRPGTPVEKTTSLSSGLSTHSSSFQTSTTAASEQISSASNSELLSSTVTNTTYVNVRTTAPAEHSSAEKTARRESTNFEDNFTTTLLVFNNATETEATTWPTYSTSSGNGRISLGETPLFATSTAEPLGEYENGTFAHWENSSSQRFSTIGPISNGTRETESRSLQEVSVPLSNASGSSVETDYENETSKLYSSLPWFDGSSTSPFIVISETETGVSSYSESTKPEGTFAEFSAPFLNASGSVGMEYENETSKLYSSLSWLGETKMSLFNVTNETTTKMTNYSESELERISVESTIPFTGTYSLYESTTPFTLVDQRGTYLQNETEIPPSETSTETSTMNYKKSSYTAITTGVTESPRSEFSSFPSSSSIISVDTTREQESKVPFSYSHELAPSITTGEESSGTTFSPRPIFSTPSYSSVATITTLAGEIGATSVSPLLVSQPHVPGITELLESTYESTPVEISVTSSETYSQMLTETSTKSGTESSSPLETFYDEYYREGSTESYDYYDEESTVSGRWYDYEEEELSSTGKPVSSTVGSTETYLASTMLFSTLSSETSSEVMETSTVVHGEENITSTESPLSTSYTTSNTSKISGSTETSVSKLVTFSGETGSEIMETSTVVYGEENVTSTETPLSMSYTTSNTSILTESTETSVSKLLTFSGETSSEIMETSTVVYGGENVTSTESPLSTSYTTSNTSIISGSTETSVSKLLTFSGETSSEIMGISTVVYGEENVTSTESPLSTSYTTSNTSIISGSTETYSVSILPTSSSLPVTSTGLTGRYTNESSSESPTITSSTEELSEMYTTSVPESTSTLTSAYLTSAFTRSGASTSPLPETISSELEEGTSTEEVNETLVSISPGTAGRSSLSTESLGGSRPGELSEVPFNFSTEEYTLPATSTSAVTTEPLPLYNTGESTILGTEPTDTSETFDLTLPEFLTKPVERSTLNYTESLREFGKTGTSESPGSSSTLLGTVSSEEESSTEGITPGFASSEATGPDILEDEERERQRLQEKLKKLGEKETLLAEREEELKREEDEWKDRKEAFTRGDSSTSSLTSTNASFSTVTTSANMVTEDLRGLREHLRLKEKDLNDREKKLLERERKLEREMGEYGIKRSTLTTVSGVSTKSEKTSAEVGSVKTSKAPEESLLTEVEESSTPTLSLTSENCIEETSMAEPGEKEESEGKEVHTISPEHTSDREARVSTGIIGSKASTTSTESNTIPTMETPYKTSSNVPGAPRVIPVTRKMCLNVLEKGPFGNKGEGLVTEVVCLPFHPRDMGNRAKPKSQHFKPASNSVKQTTILRTNKLILGEHEWEEHTRRVRSQRVKSVSPRNARRILWYYDDNLGPLLCENVASTLDTLDEDDTEHAYQELNEIGESSTTPAASRTLIGHNRFITPSSRWFLPRVGTPSEQRGRSRTDGDLSFDNVDPSGEDSLEMQPRQGAISRSYDYQANLVNPGITDIEREPFSPLVRRLPREDSSESGEATTDAKTRVPPGPEWPTEKASTYHVGGTRTWKLEFPDSEYADESSGRRGDETGTTCVYVVVEDELPERQSSTESYDEFTEGRSDDRTEDDD